MKESSETLLIVDDEPDLLKGLKRLILPALGCRVLTADSARKALEILGEETVDVVLSDIRMPEMDGLELLKRIKESFPHTAVMLMTAYGSIEMAVSALKEGAYDFVTKPLDDETLIHSLKNCLERQGLLRNTATLKRRIQENEQIACFIGSSPLLQKVLDTIRLVARTNLSVLITGESGTGKELAARTIHALSERHSREIVAVNCPAIPETILESELFGYRKGAFTNALTDKKGLFEEAHGSTLFLDEIGDLPFALQAKLLRVIQEREIKPLGDTRVKKVDVRIIASTNQDLNAKMKEGEFREDLYYRLSEISIKMPPLREMKEDIPLLANYFMERFRQDLKQDKKTFSPDAMRKLMQEPWKGNVRELQNVVKRSMLFSPSDVIGPDDLVCELEHAKETAVHMDNLSAMPYKKAREAALEQFTVGYITRLLEQHGGNVSSAARECGLERQSLQHLMRKYGLMSEDFKK